MIRQTVHISWDRKHPQLKKLNLLIRRAAKVALAAEGANVPCVVDIAVTDDEHMREINRVLRGVDKSTDVLSFPLLELTPGRFETDEADRDPDSGLVALGDMVINFQRVYQQAEEFGHSPEREAAYLTVHSILHLLGYDHLDEGEDKKLMRGREEAIMKLLGLERE